MLNFLLRIDAAVTQRLKEARNGKTDFGDALAIGDTLVDATFNTKYAKEAAAQLKVKDTGRKIRYSSLSPEELSDFLLKNR